jgi:hypothetical protein
MSLSDSGTQGQNAHPAQHLGTRYSSKTPGAAWCRNDGFPLALPTYTQFEGA